MVSASEAPANVRVLVRVRPVNDAERATGRGASGRSGVLTLDGGGRGGSVPMDFGNGDEGSGVGSATVTVNDVGGGYDSDSRGSSTSTVGGGKTFMFDAVHGPRSTQSDVFESVKGIVDSVASGYNGTVVAYGQTGSGKTHTVFGSGGCESESAGLVQRSLKALFRNIAMSQAQDAAEGCTITSGGDNLLEDSFEGDGIRKTTARASFFEIFNERVYDLLHGESLETALPVREDSVRGVYVDGLQEVEVNDTAEAENILARGNANRQVASTAMNRTSSRSHAVFVLTVKSVFTNGDGLSKVRTSKFTLVDLAGSERQKSTNAVGDRLKEASSINTSLLTLGNVINALVDKEAGRERHVPFRDSKLTFLLRDSWGGNSKTCLVATVSPSASSVSETLSTLKFAQRAKLIKNTAVLNEDTCGTVAALQAEVARLRSQLEHSGESAGAGEPSSAAQVSIPSRPSLSQNTSSSNSVDGTCMVQITERRARRAEGQLSKLENELSRKEDVVKSLKRKLQEEHLVRKFKQRRIEYLSRKADGSDEDVNDEIMALRGEVDALRRQIEAPSPDTVELKVECDLVREELEQRKDNCPGEFDQHERESLEGIINKLTDEKRLLEEKLTELSNNSSETTKEIEAVLEEVGRLEREAQSQKDQLKSREEEVWVANERVSTAEAKCDELQSELVTTKEEVSTAMSELALLRESTEELQRTIERLTQQVEEKKKTIFDIEAAHAKTRDELTSKISELSKRLEESHLASDDKATAELEVREQLAAASKDNSILVQRIQEAAAELDKQKIMMKETEERMQQVQREKAEAISQMDSKVKDMESALDTKVKALEEEKHDLLVKVDNIEKTAEEERKKTEESATAEISNLKSAISEIEQQFQTVQEEKEELKNVAKQKEASLEAKVQTIEEEKQGLETRLASLKAEAEEATSAANDTLAAERASYETRVSELEDSIQSLRSEKEQSVEEAMNRLEDVKESHGATIKSLEAEKEATSEHIKALEKGAQEAKAKEAESEEERKVRDESLKEAQSTINELEQRIQSLQAEKDQAVANGQREIEEAKILKAEKEATLQTMKIASEEATAKAEAEASRDRNIHEQAVKDMEERISNLVDAKDVAVKELNTTKSFFEAKVKSLEDEKCELSRRLVELQNESRKELQDKIASVQEEKERSIDEVRSELQATLEKRDSEIEEGRAKSELAATRIKSLEALIEESKMSADDASLKATTELDGLRTTIADMQASLAEKNEQLERARADMQTEIDLKGKEVEDIQQTFNAMEGDFKHQVAQIEEERDNITCNLQGKITTLEAERQTLTEQASLWERAADDAKKRSQGLSDKVKLANRAKSSLEFELDTLREDQDTLTEQVRCLHDRNDELEQEVTRLTKLLQDGGKPTNPALSPKALVDNPSPEFTASPQPQPVATPFRDLSSKMDACLNRMSEVKDDSLDDSFDEDMFLPNAAAEPSPCNKELSFLGHVDNKTCSGEATDKENATPFKAQSSTKKNKPFSARKENVTPGKVASVGKKLPGSERKGKTPHKTPSAVKKFPRVLSETKVRTGWGHNLNMK